MKQTIILSGMLLCMLVSFGQTTLSFCASVETNGYCNLNNNKFFTSLDTAGTRLFMELKADKDFTGISKVIFKIYSVDKTGKEKYETMSEQNVQETWMFAWAPHVFQTAGKYNIKAYNNKDELIISKTLELVDGK